MARPDERQDLVDEPHRGVHVRRVAESADEHDGVAALEHILRDPRDVRAERVHAHAIRDVRRDATDRFGIGVREHLHAVESRPDLGLIAPPSHALRFTHARRHVVIGVHPAVVGVGPDLVFGEHGRVRGRKIVAGHGVVEHVHDVEARRRQLCQCSLETALPEQRRSQRLVTEAPAHSHRGPPDETRDPIIAMTPRRVHVNSHVPQDS